MPDLAMLDYFYGDEAEQFTFYRIPKVLFTDPSYRRISSDAKILYGLMLDRMGLSVRNGWLDEYNRVFIFFTLEDALEYLCCGHTKAVSLFGELDKAGLIERKKQGQGKPTKIYVKNFVRNAEVLTSEKRKSKVPQSGSQDFQKTASNNTEIKDTELSDTEPSIHPARGLPEDKSPAADAMDTMRVYRQIIMENIEYDITRRQLGYDADILDEIVDIMVDTVCSTKPMIRIGGQDFPLEVVKSRLLKLNSEHISYVVSSLKSNTTKVRNIRAYLLTALYNAPMDIQARLQGRGPGMERWMKIHNLKEAAKTLNYLTEHGITEYDVLASRVETAAADFETVSISIKQMEHRMEQIAALKTHIINYAKTRNTYLAYRKTKAADKPAFRAAHETDLLLHEAAKRAFDALGVKKLPTVKVLQAEYTDLLAKKKAAYEDFKRLRQENQELQAVKSNVDSLLQIKQEEKKEQKQEKKQEQDR